MGAQQQVPGLIGRGAVWAELLALLDDERPDRAAALLAGAAGMGKTALVTRFAEHAADRGHPVLRVTGDSGMPGVAYAALRVLLDGRDLTQLSAARQRALRLALAGQEQGADVLVLRAAACEAIGDPAGDRPVVLVVDDVDRVDAPSLDVLLTLASVVALGQAPMVALFAARTERMPVELSELLPATVLSPLAEPEAERLLDRVPGAPVGAARLEILRRAEGNPLALREFADWADLPGGRPGVDDVFARRVHDLPERTRWALTLAAAGERNPAVLAAADPSADADAWQPAVDAGLITVTETVIHFRHPLVERALLVSSTIRARAHRTLAAGVADPRRALWHRAAATEGPDPGLAAELVAACDLLDGTGVVTAVTILERAAALMPADRRAPTLLDAAARAGAVGRLRWARELLDRARAALDPAVTPALGVSLDSFGSWLETMAGRLGAAAELLTGVLTSVPATAGISNTAAFPAFLLGDGPLTEVLARACADVPADPPWLFPLMVCRPSEEARAGCLLVPEGESPADQYRSAPSGAAAMLADEPEKAVRLLAPAVNAVVGGAAAAVHLAAPGAAGWALIDLGRWVEAEDRLVPLLSSPVAAEAPLIRAGTYAQLAVIALLRGRRETAADLVARSPIDLLTVPVFALRLRWAQGVAALAAGELDDAYRLLTAAFAVPHNWRVLVLPDLVAAATRKQAAGVETPDRVAAAREQAAAGLGAADWAAAREQAAAGLGAADWAAAQEQAAAREQAAAEAGAADWAATHDQAAAAVKTTDLVAAPRAHAAAAVDAAWQAYGKGWLSTRARARLTAARALLADDLDVAAALLEGPEAARHPFERATLAAEVANRMRRAQQPRPARELLTGALDSFERLGAAGWAGHVSAQLRGGAPVADPFATLTAQQEQIVRMAAGGLSNREIGERLFLSPRTIGSHLYRVFPQLGVVNRTQLGELVAARGGGR
ncbi:helix-turn-helix transcriptional regulator [Actinoplanes sp. LDG1-06]|uniref:Helix-turn-helix transcriptional regulator n=1 Tax=Paractinoplanes ovalisporus TaxID=2810368 RepID=A0ABS2AQH8_9ACTN|nr:helix-turn-helix transcriptional regulator [Actinoplanes ovalisporus]MBM2621993.1 helix-turn-helix transcriptional regulator [Actinoplanes ovalisporus]